MIPVLAGLIFSAFVAHYCFSDGRLFWPSSGSLWRVDRALDICFLVLPVFFMGGILIGLRPLDAGFDTPHYVEAWLALEDFDSARAVGAEIYGNSELLWWPLQSLFREFFSPQGWLFFNYTLVFLSVFWVYRTLGPRYSVNPLIFALVFLTYFFVYSGNAIRQALALPLGVLAFCWWFDRRYARALLALALSVGLHWSSLVFIVAPLLSLPVLRRQSVMLLLPGLALLATFFLDDIARLLVYAVGLPELIEKYQLYFEEGRESHIGVVWKQLNFWLCGGVSLVFLWVCKPSGYASLSLHLYVVLFLSLMLFGISVSDVSERFFPALFLVMPLMAMLILQRFEIPDTLAELILTFAFFVLWLMVCSTESAQATLGYRFF